MKTLRLHEDYSREDVHDIFDPDSTFTPQAGTWGLQGIITIPDRPGDFVFFVTFGKREGEHEFDEGISTEGVFRWQSQPRQRLDDPQVRQLISHDEDRNNIYLFLRTSARVADQPMPYTYLGRLKYIAHDMERQQPVYFDWQLLDWPISDIVSRRMALELESISGSRQDLEAEEQQETIGITSGLIEEPAPQQSTPSQRRGSPTKRFKGHGRGDHAKRDEANRKLGRAGELMVLEHERKTLTDNGHPELADKVRHIAEEEGDGAGYDILSYRVDGTRRHIEVKTTTGPSASDFFISANEVEFSRTHAETYELRRVYDFHPKQGGRFYSILGDVTQTFELSPTQYRVTNLEK